ncbi:LOW QUALITY PROTEIN: Serine/threonine protein kinase [Phytophthora palmivora]|uniref:Serine/threonine protein kinase n=1 Tax=Phytophthora palmivora TaxID=4796 RepID=A0A2P4YBQ6_9STRA|nr:LOW QUALITY PROTEIN: Serine/threonine protein kinase [Phytophthora palmivora]
MEAVSFPITTLPGLPPSTDVLARALPQRIRRLPECEVFFQTLLGLLRNVHDAVLAHDDQWKAAFCDVIKQFIKLLRLKPLLERLAGGEMVAYTFRDLNVKVDEIFVGVGLTTQPWADDWERGCRFQAERLRNLVSGAAPRMLIGEMRDEKQVTKAMLGMYVWLEGGTSGDLDALKRETLDRLRVTLGLLGRTITSETVAQVDELPRTILPIFKWFIPERDVTIIGDPIGSGSSGFVSRAKWRHRDGTTQNVIVKTMYYDYLGSEVAFLKQLQFWYDLPKHPNIVRLYGGCHLARPPFFVCEDVHNGDIVDFLGKEENRGLFWSMFLKVAEGLQELHAHHIVHDGLKGSNILIGENNTPKISDFACSTIRALSAQFSHQAKTAQEGAVHWKPREKLVEVNDTLPQYKSDVYSLGMCMVEALTQDAPFGMETLESEVMDKIVGGITYERPEEASLKEWSVISRLIAVNIDDRPDILETIALIRSLVGEDVTTSLSHRSTTRIAKWCELSRVYMDYSRERYILSTMWILSAN